MVLVKSHPMAIKSPKIIKAVSLENERPLQKCHNNLGQLTVNKGFKSSQNCNKSAKLVTLDEMEGRRT